MYVWLVRLDRGCWKEWDRRERRSLQAISVNREWGYCLGSAGQKHLEKEAIKGYTGQVSSPGKDPVCLLSKIPGSGVRRTWEGRGTKGPIVRRLLGMLRNLDYNLLRNHWRVSSKRLTKWRQFKELSGGDGYVWRYMFIKISSCIS